MKCTLLWQLVLFLNLSCLGETAVSPNAPDPAYYQQVEGMTGEELKQELHRKIRNHTRQGYRSLWEHLRITDGDPEHPGNILLLYSGWSLPNDQNGGQPSQWNREHLWPKSHGLSGQTGPMSSDLHHICPTDVSVNSRRGHLNFDVGGEPYSDPDGSTGCRVDEDSWEPRDEVKGDIARMLFYMVVRYEGTMDGEPDLELIDEVENLGQPRMGKRSVLLRWHAEDPVDDFERRRNQRIFEIQGNRNPFIDHPEWVALIWE